MTLFRSQSPQRRPLPQRRAQMHNGSALMTYITYRYQGTRTAVRNHLFSLLMLLRIWWQQCNDTCHCSVDSDCCDIEHRVSVSTFVLAESCVQ